VVGDSSGGSGVFLEESQPGRGLTGVEDLAPGSLDLAGEGTGLRGDSAQALEEVEGGPFALEEPASGASDFREDFSVFDGVSVVLEEVEIVEHERQDFSSGEYEVLASEKPADGTAAGWDTGGAGDVACSDVLFEGAADDEFDVVHRTFFSLSRCVLYSSSF
jgi:hypothetical protein